MQKEKTKLKKIPTLILLCALMLLLAFVIRKNINAQDAPPPDEHAGMVQVYDGSEYIWITPDERLEKSKLSPDKFTQDSNGRPIYTGDDYVALRGVDVSDYQPNIDWQKVYDSGVRFAIIRAGGRYYGTKGALFTDDDLKKNLEEAKKAGLMVGVYFFSQAVNVKEAEEEAKLTLKLIGDVELDLPIYFDWEIISDDTARTDDVDGKTLTDCALAFCKTVEKAGFTAGVYLYGHLAYHGYELSRISDYSLWYADPGHSPTFYYAADIWQCSFSGEVPGIWGTCDTDVLFLEK